MLPRFWFSLMIFIGKAFPMSLSRSRTGRRSTCEPGRNARTPMSTIRPPLVRPRIMPEMGAPFS